MKETPTHYYCNLVGGIQTKNNSLVFSEEWKANYTKQRSLIKLKNTSSKKLKNLMKSTPDASPLTFPLHNTQKKTNITYAGLSLTTLSLCPLT